MTRKRWRSSQAATPSVRRTARTTRAKCLVPEPAAAGVEQQGLGWENRCGKGHGDDAITSGLDGAWSGNPTAWTSMYLDNLFAYDWVRPRARPVPPSGCPQGQAADQVPDAADPNKRHAPMMFTTDLALKLDPAYYAVARRFHEHPEEFQRAFAHAWFKLTHRDMGPRARYLGHEVPREELSWQDPVPAVDHPLLTTGDVAQLKAKILDSGLATADWCARPGRRPHRFAAPTGAGAPTAAASAWPRKKTGPSTTRPSSRGS